MMSGTPCQTSKNPPRSISNHDACKNHRASRDCNGPHSSDGAPCAGYFGCILPLIHLRQSILHPASRTKQCRMAVRRQSTACNEQNRHRLRDLSKRYITTSQKEGKQWPFKRIIHESQASVKEWKDTSSPSQVRPRTRSNRRCRIRLIGHISKHSQTKWQGSLD